MTEAETSGVEYFLNEYGYGLYTCGIMSCDEAATVKP
jgi:hypothetical protein